MTTAVSLRKVTMPTAAQICRDIQLEPEALRCLADDLAPAAFLRNLIELKLFPDAVRFLARALPKREATWWACISARSVVGPDTKPEVVKALEQPSYGYSNLPNPIAAWRIAPPTMRRSKIRRPGRRWRRSGVKAVWHRKTCRPCRRPTI